MGKQGHVATKYGTSQYNYHYYDSSTTNAVVVLFCTSTIMRIDTTTTNVCGGTTYRANMIVGITKLNNESAMLFLPAYSQSSRAL